MDVETIIDQINQVRRETNITYQQIADASGVPRSTVSRILRGETPNPTSKNLHDISRAVGCQILWPPQTDPSTDGADIVQIITQAEERRTQEIRCLYNTMLAKTHRWLVCSVTTISVLLLLLVFLTAAVLVLALR